MTIFLCHSYPLTISPPVPFELAGMCINWLTFITLATTFHYQYIAQGGKLNQKVGKNWNRLTEYSKRIIAYEQKLHEANLAKIDAMLKQHCIDMAKITKDNDGI